MTISKRTSYIGSFIGGFILASMVFVSLIGFIYNDVEPYTNVRVIASEWVTLQDYIVSVAFTKNDDCVYRDLLVYGEYLGEWTKLEWAAAAGDQGDRIAGEHTLHLTVDTGGEVEYDQLELRTRHDCDGVKTDAIFTVITLPDH